CDYGEVLAMAPSPADRAALEVEIGADVSDFWARYWQHRPAYDRGDLDTAGYWSLALKYAPRPIPLRRLVELDTIMWSRPNQASLDATSRAAARGVKLAVLSNAPAELADSFNQLPWLAPFDPRLFSGHLGAIKPEPRIYAMALAALNAEPEDVSFIDDRPENIRAASRAGLHATLFRSAGQIDNIYPP
ncbi:MAG TPA: HAD-IA family hydrolase, partial [Acidimicrobiales bacterium]|nr:HAD-IA family hydrolase [Acidimicrobiales bacterium]